METIDMVAMTLLVIGIVVYFAMKVLANSMVRSVEKAVREEIIEPYRKRLNGSNRFILNRDVLKTLYPHQSKQVLDKVWQRLVETHAVRRDQHDDEWCI